MRKNVNSAAAKKWYTIICAAVFCIAGMLLSVTALEPESEKQVIRVAFPVQEAISEYMEDGDPEGYNYQYLEKLSELTGWELEYVRYENTDENEALLEAINDLKAGKVDLLGPMLKTKSAEEQFEYPEMSYGTVYTTLCALNTSSLREENINLQSPLRVGLLAQAETSNKEIQNYLDAEKFNYTLLYYQDDEALQQALQEGEVDVISGASLSPVSGTRVVKNFNPRPYYFVSTKGNTALLLQLDEAISTLNQLQPNYQSELFEKYFGNNSSEFLLSSSQKEFLKSIGTLHVLCVDRDGPYVFQKDGKPTGMLVSLINNFVDKSEISVEYTFCQNRREAEKLLVQSDYDMLIGIPLTSQYCASLGFITSETVMESNFLLACDLSNDKQETVALVDGAEGLVDTSAYQTVKLYDNTEDCLDAVKKGEVDAAIGDRSILEYYTHDGQGSLDITLLSGETQNICIALSKKCDAQLLYLFNNYIYNLTDVEKTNYLDDGSVHADRLNFSLFVQTYPIQAVILVSVLSVALALVVFGFYYVRKMRKKNEELRLANDVRSDFLTRMSHDIRTPMNGIIGLLDISDRFLEEPNTVRKYHRKIHMAAEYLLSLINDVLDMSKLEAGKIQLARESIYLREIIDNCKDILEARANDEGITLNTCRLDEFNPPRVFTSPLHLRQIFMNIIGNAIKYNRPNGSVNITARIAEQSESIVTCEFTVQDTGIGMSEQFQKHAFDAFAQENQTVHGELKGTGLGLSIVKKLVDAMGGDIRIQSQLGKGTAFIWVLPFKVDKDYHGRSEDKINPKLDCLRGCRILAAEDNALNVEILQFMLEDAGMHTVIVENGRQAVDVFADSEPGSFDFILMDIMMPKMNGYEAAKAIRSMDHTDAKDIPIIAVTANAFPEDKQKVLDAGMNDHISKPIAMDTLLAVLSKYRVAQ